AELGFWLPVELTWPGGSTRALYVPYLFVDNPAALIAGREVYGFNKILGQFSYLGDAIDPIDVKAQALPTRGAATRLDWLTVAAFTGSLTRLPATWSSATDAVTGVLSELLSLLVGVERPSDPSLTSFPLVFLKQFRDAADGANACHQSIVLVRAAFTQFSGGLLMLSGLHLRLTGYDTMDIGKTLGLPEVASPVLGFWLKFSAEVGPGQPLVGI